MPSIAHPQMIALGPGPVARVLAKVFGALLVPDDWLIRQTWDAATTFAKPLVGCRYVFQVISDAESPDRARWRHDAFWRLYGESGGKSRAAPGLKWLLLDCRNCGSDEVPWVAKFCQHISPAGGLRQILVACDVAKPYAYSDWHDAHLADREFWIREEIFRLVQDSEGTAEAFARIRELAKDLSPLAWERFCPPPNDHALANRIRAWLRPPETDSVTPWIAEGRALLKQTTLTL